MAKTSRRANGKAATARTATIHDQKLDRGEGGELHQVARGDTPVLTTAQGGPVSATRTRSRSVRAGRP